MLKKTHRGGSSAESRAAHDLADPRVLVQLAVEAEDAGWDGVFVWDHVRWREPVRAAADPWIALTAMAGATSRIRIGPMVTPLARRRPAKLAAGDGIA